VGSHQVLPSGWNAGRRSGGCASLRIRCSHLGLLRPRFWCKYVCPSGAVFSLGNLFRTTERKVESSCIQCNKCVTVCPLDAIKPDFTTGLTDCTLCQTCGGVCPSHSIKFVERWNVFELKDENTPATGETAPGRRGFVSLAAGTAAAVAGGAGIASATRLFGAGLDDPNSPRPVRPPGSVPEEDFLQMCIRCGECFKSFPNNVLHTTWIRTGTARPVDTRHERRLGRLRVKLQRMWAGLPHRRHPAPATRREEGSKNGTRHRQRDHLPAIRRS